MYRLSLLIWEISKIQCLTPNEMTIRYRNNAPHAPLDILDYSLSPKVTRKSRVISKLNQLLAILGATLRRFGPIPLNNPRSPSSATITLTASQMEVYWYPIPDIVLIWNRRRSTSLFKENQFSGNQNRTRGNQNSQRIGACLRDCSRDRAS